MENELRDTITSITTMNNLKIFFFLHVNQSCHNTAELVISITNYFLPDEIFLWFLEKLFLSCPTLR